MTTENSPPNGAKRVLVVDDDAGIRLLISHHLKKNGYDAVVAAGVSEAQSLFNLNSETRFDAVVTDYLMPDGTGLDLLEWIKQKDATLAAIFVTAVGERDLVKKSLRTGACDFLDKPVQIQLLLQAVGQAIDRTHRQRQLQDAESSVQEVGKLQQFLLGTNPASLPGTVEICWHPKHAAGGDLVNVFSLGPERLLVVVADVSGHDLKAGFISAFFQGVVRGMIESATPISKVFSYFNRFLIREWSGSQTDRTSQYDVSASVAVCAFDIDFSAGHLIVWNNGFPVPIFTDCNGRSKRCGETASHPLGWFDEWSTTLFEQRIDCGGYAYAWTDGLEDLAGQMGVSQLSLAENLLRARREGITPAFLKDCGDDILVVRLNLAPKGVAAGSFKPLLFEEYFSPHGMQIDQLQSNWEKSLQTALPEMPESKMFDLLLCSREAVINGIKYGCGAKPSEPCSYEVTYQPESHLLRVIISDPGPGHDFDWAGHEEAAEEELTDSHRGLILINRLPDRTRVERDGASVTMDFNLKQP